MIAKLHIQNFKCLRDVSVELEPFTVLIGKNDTGKSSLLEAIQTLGGLVASPPRLPRLPIDKLAFRGADAPSITWSVEVGATARNQLPGTAKYELSVTASKVPGEISVAREQLDVPGVNAKYLGSGYGHSGPSTRLLAEGSQVLERVKPDFTSTAVAMAGAEPGYPRTKVFARALATSAIYRLDPERLAQPAYYELAPSADPESVPELGSDGAGLPLVLDYLLGSDRSTFAEIERELKSVIPHISAIRIKPFRAADAAGVVRVGKTISFELQGGHEIPATLASQGVMLFLAYLTLARSPSPPDILLIEEPENGVHPRQLQRIAATLQGLTEPGRGANAVQIVTATHSPYFLDFVPPDGVLVFGRKATGETVVAPLLDLPGVKQRLDSGFSLGEMWFNVGEDRLLADILQ